ncbi:protein RKD4 isoform X1 [Vigna radiata var. radiata]|uniref:Protein RKD4 isoform X1 n=2 Tax=Vigna radiata var. radiata TaxID=3916 RepID=A0A3Q0FKF4_VIGRR|nr:protein RKD4 isoform X1 [Vigna radiata var. radiata]
MEFASEHDFPNFEIIPHTFASCFFSAQLYPTDKAMMDVSLSPLEGFSGHDWTQQLPYSSKQLCLNEFPDLENLDLDFSLPPLGEDLEEVEQKPLNIIVVPEEGHCGREKGFGDALLAIENGSAICVKKEEVQNIEQMAVPSGSSGSKKKKKPCALEFEEIKKHFDVPINEAAKQMNVGLTMLKRRCRELNIMRWPHRKLKSLQLLIENVKELGLADEVPMLEKHKRLLEKLPGLELCAKAKKLRQACFKANYKRRRFMGMTLQA